MVVIKSTILIYKNLSQYLDYKIYMFTHYETDDLLEEYVNQILELKISEVILMGYSFGGTIAFEIAQRLKKHKIKIKGLVFIDSYVAKKNRFSHIGIDEDTYLSNIVNDFLKRKSAQEIFKYNEDIKIGLISNYKLFHKITKNINTTINKLDIDIYQLIASDTVEWISDTRCQWKSLCKNYYESEVIGSHSELLDSKNIIHNAGEVVNVLERLEND